MIRNIIEIDRDLCNACGLCVDACHEGAIAIVDGKAQLMNESYCDGLGDCLPQCPMNAIKMVQREALDYDEETVKKRMIEKNIEKNGQPVFSGCPSQMAKLFSKKTLQIEGAEKKDETSAIPSELRQWPIQIKLVPSSAPYLEGADLLIAADCTAFSYGSFHQFMKGKITLIGCPKLDEGDYSEKLTEILIRNDIRSITVARMEVPCCGGIVNAVKTALLRAQKIVPFQIVVFAVDGGIV